MGGHHGHRADDDEVVVGRLPRVLLLTSLALAGVATIIGVWRLWPGDAELPEMTPGAAYAAPGVTFPEATVVKVQPPCPMTDQSEPGTPPDAGYQPSARCGHLTARLNAPEAGRHENEATVSVDVPPEVAGSGLRGGDRVQLVRQPPAEGQPAFFSYFTTRRDVPLGWLALAFALVVVAVARLRGVMAMVTLAFGGFMVVRFMLPALLEGEPGTWVALAGCSAIMFVVLYGTHGPSLRTSAALAGTLVGLAITAAIGAYAIRDSRLTGVSDESGALLSTFVRDLNFPGLLMCGLIIASLGVLNDVTITQSSSVWELRAAAPDATRRAVFVRAMRIGRDHIASSIYTIVFAYSGASIVLLLLLSVYEQPVLDLVSSEGIAEEIVRTLASGIGLVLAVPVTTAIAAAAAGPSSAGDNARRSSRPDDRHPHDQFWKPRHQGAGGMSDGMRTSS